MPNHCENYLHVNGDRTDMARFVAAIKDPESGEFNLKLLMPMPDDIAQVLMAWFSDEDKQREHEARKTEMFAKYGVTDAWHWATERWGTKWGDYDYWLENVEEESCEFAFLTAWCPFKTEFWEQISTEYPKLRFVSSYYEPGMGFAGAITVENGICLFDEYVDDVTENLPNLTDENWDEWMDAKDQLVSEIQDRASDV